MFSFFFFNDTATTEIYTVYLALPVLLNLRDGQWNGRRFANYLLAAAVHLPMVGVYLCFAHGNPLGMTGWDLASGFFLPGWGRPGFLLEMVFWLGWPFLLCCAGMPWLLRLRGVSKPQVFLVLWLLTAWLICNLYPYWGAGQEAGFHPFHLAPVLIVVGGFLPALEARLHARGRRVSGPRRTAAAVALVLLSMPTTAIVYADMFHAPQTDDMHASHYLDRDTCAALEWLDTNGREGDIVLASYPTSQFIPWITGLKTVTGHYMFTIDRNAKNRAVQQFFATAYREDLHGALLNTQRVRFVVYGENERRLGTALPHGGWPGMAPVHRVGSTTVYRVARADGAGG